MKKGNFGQGFLDVIPISDSVISVSTHLYNTYNAFRGIKLNLVAGGVAASSVFVNYTTDTATMDAVNSWLVSNGYGSLTYVVNVSITLVTYDHIVSSAEVWGTTGYGIPHTSWAQSYSWTTGPTVSVLSGGFYLYEKLPFLALKLFNLSTRVTALGGLGFITPNSSHDIFVGALTADYSTLGHVEMASKLFVEGEVELIAQSGYDLVNYTHALVYIRKYE